MAELRQLWPKLKKKLSSGGVGEGGKKKRIHGNANTNNNKKSSSKQPNPYSTHGLDKLAVVVAELQAKKTSLVDHTGNSVAAARSLSRSAQEWTATTLARTASRGRRGNNTQKETSPSSTTQSPSPSFSRPSEILLLQCSPQSSVGNTELIDFSHSFSFAASSDAPAIVGELSADDDGVVMLGRDEMADDEIAAMAERRSDPQEVGCSGSSVVTPVVVGIASLPSKGSLPINKKGRGLKGKGWRAVAVLVALGAYIVSHTANFVNPLAAAMSFSVVITRWHKGKICAKFVFFRYFLTPLQTYITAHSPRRVLAILPARKVEKEEAADVDVVADVDSQLSARDFELHPKAETTDEVATTTHIRHPSFGFPVLPLGSMPPSPMRLAAPSSLLGPSISAPATLASLLATTEDEITPAGAEVEVEFTAPPGVRRFSLSPASSIEREGVSPTRRLARKILLKLKVRKSSKAASSDDVAREDDASSSTADSPMPSLQSGATTPLSGSEPGSPMFSHSPSPSPSRVSSPERHHRKFPFSRKAKGKSSLGNNNNDAAAAASSAHGGELHTTEQNHPKALERRSSGNKRCILRRDKASPDHGHGSGGSNASRKSVLCRMGSADSIDHVPTTSQAPAGPELSSSSQPGAAEEAKEKNVEVWPMVGLLVTLLFLMVGKFPAIVATSCFFIVLSTRDKSHHRPLGRGTGRALEAARKLNKSPPPRAGIRVTPPGSPARDEYRKWGS